MEVALAAPQILSAPLRRGTPVPLNQLVEESRSRANIPNPLLESKMYSKVQSNSLIQAEPPVLHFSGFELEKDYIKILKLINVSSEVMNIHILPTQTEHFHTSYTKKYRLIPGLAYTLKVRFCPDEWRYFYDCIRVHCQGEENLLIPVHAYPVIDDLHIPPHIDLPAVPLGRSICRAIPLRCSCPIDFEFQVCVMQRHDAFSIHPLAGVVPASGEVEIVVTFRPLHYETSHVTIQLVVSQFNTKPFLCTITGSCAPPSATRELRTKSGHGEFKRPSPVTQVRPRSKTKQRTCKDNLKMMRDGPGLKPPVDVCTPAGVAKILIKDANKLSCRDLREAVSRDGAVGLQDRQAKEALFIRKVQENVKEEQANHIRWHVHLGKDPVSGASRRQVVEEREIALHEYKVKRGDVRHEEAFAAGEPELSSRRLLWEAGKACEGAPSFQFYPSFPWELRRRVLTLFQQAARKVAIRCRMKRRLTCLKELSERTRSSAEREETLCDPKISPDRVFPFAFPIFSDEDDPLALRNVEAVPVDPIDVAVTTRIPFFKLQAPQHYKLMGYRPVSAWEAFSSCSPAPLTRPLRTGAAEEEVPDETQFPEREDENEEEGKTAGVPEALLRPPPANPLRIFNPAPGLQAYTPTAKYMETDLDFHLCPLPRYAAPGTPTQKKFLDHKEVITGIVTWKNFESMTSNCLRKQPALTSDCAARRSVDYSADTLPLTAPPPLAGPPDELPSLIDKPCEASGVQLTPEMIRAQFLAEGALVSNSNPSRGTTARHRRELQMEEACRSEVNLMGRRVTTRLKQLEVASHPPAEDCEDQNTPIHTLPDMHRTPSK